MTSEYIFTSWCLYYASSSSIMDPLQRLASHAPSRPDGAPKADCQMRGQLRADTWRGTITISETAASQREACLSCALWRKGTTPVPFYVPESRDFQNGGKNKKKNSSQTLGSLLRVVTARTVKLLAPRRATLRAVNGAGPLASITGMYARGTCMSRFEIVPVHGSARLTCYGLVR